jgi:predicted Na+-dependent transporter
MSDSKLMETLVEILTKVLLFLLIFGMASTVDIKNIKEQMKNKHAIIMGITMQFLIMPLLGFVSVVVFKKWGLTTAMGISLLIVTSSPGGSYSNW